VRAKRIASRPNVSESNGRSIITEPYADYEGNELSLQVLPPIRVSNLPWACGPLPLWGSTARHTA